MLGPNTSRLNIISLEIMSKMVLFIQSLFQQMINY